MIKPNSYPKEKPRYYRQLRRQFTAIIFFIAFVPLILLSGTIYYHYSRTVKEKIRNELKNVVENRKSTIDLFLKDRAINLTALAHTHRFVYLKDRKNLDDVFQLLKRIDNAFVDLGVIGGDGKQVAYVGPHALGGKDYSSAEWFQSIMTKEVYVSDVFLGFRNIPHFVIAIKRVEAGKPWILRATVNTETVYHFMTTALLGKRGNAYILNREGVYQMHGRDRNRVLSKSDFKVPQLFAGIREKEEYSPDGEPLLYAMAWLKNNDWLLVIEQNLRDELGPMIHVKNVVLVIFAVSSLIIIFSTILITRRAIGSLEKVDRERSQLTDQLIHADKLAAIGRLASGIAHEINNPLAVIAEKAGWMEDLLSEGDIKNDPNYSELLKATQDIKKHVNRGKKVTHRLLGFARRMEMVYEETDLNSILDETVYFLEREAIFRNIDIIKEYQDTLPRIISDGAQLQQVFLNMLNNAIDAINKNGKIRISTKSLDGSVEVAIADTGPGIPKENLERIFDPFYTNKAVNKGTGLGLSISYGIIEKLGGQIRVESEVGKGTTFYITLPVSQPGNKV